MKKEQDKAVALKYERGKDPAPRVTAKGRGVVAERILAIAREHNIPIRQDKALLDALYRLDINEEIPEDLYRVIAEVLAFIYRMNRMKAERS
ncbi:MAG: EscU/YscU/HrcU family type III secretion system export apparatus switch protein [Desulfomonilia bacterium]|jgi:flagellar biosynthesis protein|uniref:Flagellar biosynthetic protein FlhB n=1 Tax=anaerobic digester metagenome TaxID=1263854 RepID=A0A485M3L5_9ZZZZ|nr:EscU/YscU/HrcU family type III secretion system export apparatus switch protein [Pseudomonadota bacterium]HPD22592.1 EscU/YscU/HrcU family type III secretion system export apparatus switch protein [Deltaproteobacteria bacterium]HPW69609.1 EscU/YscU/HrcU family type III secretion system export apparatus switch protein [Deltaproteobacteria bacterium]HRS57380.1 EscU/YscU/HrcU family type III secretion system export apparatus switch protein [Desulfomonilia bacterium]HRV36916.1 EscU/YscU/HrcU fam